MYACELIRMNTYCKKINVLSIGSVNRMAVKRRLEKKYAGLMIRHFDDLSIFKRSVLKLCLASRIFKISNLLKIRVIKKTGKMTEMMKTT